jgi:hypothetical protein
LEAPAIADTQKKKAKDIVKRRAEIMKKVRVLCFPGGGAGAKLGVKLSKTDFTLSEIPVVETFSSAASAIFLEYSNLKLYVFRLFLFKILQMVQEDAGNALAKV